MLNNVALDVVIGLVFIYLLYSLLATVIGEIIATKLGLRARNLKEAIDRMLNDEDKKATVNHFLPRLWDSLRLMKNPKNKIIKNFYNHPEIKYLGSTGIFKNPSSFKAVSFSKTLLYLLNGSGAVDANKIDQQLRSAAPEVLGKETAEYVLSIWEDSEKDVVKFKMQLEAWFDRTMEQATEWYKRKIQVILLIIGFTLAWCFNADTFVIVHKLTKDKTAREQMVQLTSAYLQGHPERPQIVATALNANEARDYKEKMDSLISVKDGLEKDVASVGNLLGYGSWLPDAVMVKTNKTNLEKTYAPQLEASLLPDQQAVLNTANGYLKFDFGQKLAYLFSILNKHFWVFLLTAVAISLGAPFWFDLLNKMMKLRTSIRQTAASTNTNANNTVIPYDRI
ncbi:MAG: hypothetical protein ACOH2A_10110 [Sphingobacteriaceae bacterium]